VDTYVIRCDGSEVGRVSGEGLSCGQRLTGPELMGGELIDDPKLLRMKREGKTIAVFYVSAEENVTVEKVAMSERGATIEEIRNRYINTPDMPQRGGPVEFGLWLEQLRNEVGA